MEGCLSLLSRAGKFEPQFALRVIKLSFGLFNINVDEVWNISRDLKTIEKNSSFIITTRITSFF